MRQAALETIHEGMPDTEIARRIAAGDEESFCLLMRRHNQSMYRAARSILKEVMHEGSVNQKQEAQRLLESLPG